MPATPTTAVQVALSAVRTSTVASGRFRASVLTSTTRRNHVDGAIHSDLQERAPESFLCNPSFAVAVSPSVLQVTRVRGQCQCNNAETVMASPTPTEPPSAAQQELIARHKFPHIHRQDCTEGLFTATRSTITFTSATTTHTTVIGTVTNSWTTESSWTSTSSFQIVGGTAPSAASAAGSSATANPSAPTQSGASGVGGVPISGSGVSTDPAGASLGSGANGPPSGTNSGSAASSGSSQGAGAPNA